MTIRLRTMALALLTVFALASTPACGKSKRAESCIKDAKAALGDAKTPTDTLGKVQARCDNSCTHDKDEEVCKLRDELNKKLGFDKK